MHMKFPRSSGILLHPTSLPGSHGIGELGAAAFAWIDFLESAGQKIWQVLPLGPTGYGDSPYQSFSAFAGNPLLISLDLLVERGYLEPADLAARPPFPEDHVDFGWVLHWKLPVLARAAGRFHAATRERDALAAFEARHAHWLDDFARFMARKQPYPEPVQRYWQFEFFRQWSGVKSYANQRGIRIMGDIPIFVAHDSADVWRHPDCSPGRRRHRLVAGVPPDYFSATGQLWGNPLYRWDVLAQTGYAWWIERFRASLRSCSTSCASTTSAASRPTGRCPAASATAMHGRWVQGPGRGALRRARRRRWARCRSWPRTSGVITPEVEALREQFGFPGMSILQFAFGSDAQANDFHPHNYPRERVVLHRRRTTTTPPSAGGPRAGAGDSTRSGRGRRAGTRLRAALPGHRRPARSTGPSSATVLASVADTVARSAAGRAGAGQRGAHEPARPARRQLGLALHRGDQLTPTIAHAPARTLVDALPTARRERAMTSPRLGFWQIWNMSFGFLGIQFGWGLQMANMSAIYEYLGAKADQIPMLWLAAPLTGLIVQPIIGHMSDRTWGRAGPPPALLPDRRHPELARADPDAATRRALWMAAGLLWILDASINISMEPFRAFVADLLPRRAAHARLRDAEPLHRPRRGDRLGAALDAHATGSASAHARRRRRSRLTVQLLLLRRARPPSWAPCSGRSSPRKEYPPEDLAAFRAQKAESAGLGAARARSSTAIARDARRPCGSSRRCRSAPGSASSACGSTSRWPSRATSSARRTRRRRSTSEGVEWAGLCFAVYSAVCFVFSFVAARRSPRGSGRKAHPRALPAGRRGWACCRWP